MKVETKSGFICSVDNDALGDWEILERLIAVQSGEISGLPGVMMDIIGEDGYKAAKDFCRNDRGRVPTEAIMTLFFDILTAAKEVAPEDKKK